MKRSEFLNITQAELSKSYNVLKNHEDLESSEMKLIKLLIEDKGALKKASQTKLARKNLLVLVESAKLLAGEYTKPKDEYKTLDEVFDKIENANDIAARRAERLEEDFEDDL